MAMPPTIDLYITGKDGTALAEINGLPVPLHVTPAGHIVVNSLAPVMERAVRAFSDAWEAACNESQRV